MSASGHGGLRTRNGSWILPQGALVSLAVLFEGGGTKARSHGAETSSVHYCVPSF